MTLSQHPKTRSLAWQWIGLFACGMLLSACSNQQSVLYVPTKEVDVQSMELGEVQRWPERMVTMTGRMAPCPESSADVSHALDDFEEALGTTTTLLERGNVKDAILEEWQEQMSGLYDESTTAQWGNLAGADGVAMLEIMSNATATSQTPTRSG